MPTLVWPQMKDNFNFERLGIRIPTLLVSPWINKGVVISEPSGAQKPANNSRCVEASSPGSKLKS